MSLQLVTNATVVNKTPNTFTINKIAAAIRIDKIIALALFLKVCRYFHHKELRWLLHTSWTRMFVSKIEVVNAPWAMYGGQGFDLSVSITVNEMTKSATIDMMPTRLIQDIHSWNHDAHPQHLNAFLLD